MFDLPLIRIARLFGVFALLLSSLTLGIRPAAAQAASLSINDAVLFEPIPFTGTAPLGFTISLSAPSPTPITVLVSTSSGSGSLPPATAGADFNSVTNSLLTIPANTTSVNFNVTILADGIGNEPDEFFTITLSSPVGAVLGDASGIGTIYDVPSISISDISVIEGNTGFVIADPIVTLSHPFNSGPLTVDFNDTAGTATDLTDYNCFTAPGTLTFAAGQTSLTIPCDVFGDTIDEINETFTLDIFNPIPAVAVITRPTGTVTIVDDDGAPVVSIICATPVAEPAAGSFNTTCTVSLAPVSGQPVTVNFTALGSGANPATPGADFTLVTPGSVTFTPGTTSQAISIDILGDTIDEAAETFTVALTTVTPGGAATVAPGNLGSVEIMITDSDAAPVFSVISGATVTEVNAGGTVDMVFTVQLSAISGQETRVNFATAPGVDSNGPAIGPNAATPDQDYINDTNTLIFPAGTTTQNVTVVINGDNIDEFDELLLLVLSSPVNAAVSPTQGSAIGTILDNDAPPVATITNVSVTEPDTGAVAANFTVSLSLESGKPISLNFATANGIPPSGAVSPDDFTAATGSVSFAPGDTSKPISISVKGDTISENNETFTVGLSNPNPAVVTIGGAGQGIGTIIDNDSGPTISVQDLTIDEGDSGVQVALVSIQLSAVSGKTVSVSYVTNDGTAQSNETAGAIPSTGDYTRVPITSIDIAAGTTSVQIPIEIRGDTVDEANEAFAITLSNPTNAVISDNEGTITITDNDALPVVSIGDATTPSEGNAGQTSSAVFVISLSAQSGRAVTVQFTTSNGTATAGSDYVADSRSVTFEPGATTQTVSVVVNGDSTDEANETFTATLSTPVNATLGRSVGTATIFDDDGPTVSISDSSLREPTSGTATMVFTITLNGASSYPVVVNYATANGSASAGSDYTAASGNVVFNSAADLPKTVSVTVLSDSLSESDEDFFVNLTSVSGGGVSIGDNQGRGLIRETSALTLTLNCPATVNEGNSGTLSLNCQVTLSAASAMTVTVDYSTSNGTAVAPGDYTSAVGRLTFAPGITSRSVPISVKGDTADESDETFTVRLTNAHLQQSIAVGIVGDSSDENDENFILSLLDPVGATLGNGQSQIAIIDDDTHNYIIRLPLVMNAFRIPTFPPLD
jgi:large repetitive protein